MEIQVIYAMIYTPNITEYNNDSYYCNPFSLIQVWNEMNLSLSFRTDDYQT